MKDPASPTLAELQAQVDDDGVLDLSSSGLESLPEDVGGLVRVRFLNLGNNPKLRSLPAGLGLLGELEVLHLGGLELELEHALVVALQERGCAVMMDMKDPARPTLAELQARVDKDGVLFGSLASFSGSPASSGLLVALPEDVGGLVRLRVLDLRGNPKLRSLPSGFWRLGGLEVLDLGGCELEALPEEVSELVRLLELDLRFNPKLRSLPAGLGQLESLEELDFRGCDGLELEQVSIALRERGCKVTMDLKDRARPTLAELQAMVDKDGVLDLSCSGLDLLPEMGGLVRLRVLKLRNNPKPRSLPAGLGRLESLEELDLGGCDGLELEHALVVALQEHGCKVQIDMKDPARPTLAELQVKVTADGVLDLSTCENFSNFSNLSGTGFSWSGVLVDTRRPMFGTFSTLHGLELESLPEDVGELVGLRVLNLSDNPELRSLPAGVGWLGGVEELHLNNCPKLRSLPAGLGRLESLTELNIDECPGLATLHKLQAKGGVQAVRGYLKDLQQMEGGLFEPSRRHSLKLVLAGPTEAGKTSLLRALMGLGEQRRLADLQDERTIGLDIHRFTLPDPTAQGRAALELVIYDAGRHGEYQELHQVRDRLSPSMIACMP